MEKELARRTEILLTDVEKALRRFETVKSTGVKGDFYSEVKPFADEIKQKAKEWEDEAIIWLEKHPQRHLHPQQIRSTAENLEMVSVQAFFPESSRKRFLGFIQSIQYVLNDLLQAMDKTNHRNG